MEFGHMERFLMDEKAIKSIRIDQYATLFTDDSIECPECNAVCTHVYSG